MKFASALLLTLLLALCPPAWADVSRDQAAAIAQEHGGAGARVLAVQSGRVDGQPVWRVKILTGNGEVKVILIEVASGRTR